MRSKRRQEMTPYGSMAVRLLSTVLLDDIEGQGAQFCDSEAQWTDPLYVGVVAARVADLPQLSDDRLAIAVQRHDGSWQVGAAGPGEALLVVPPELPDHACAAVVLGVGTVRACIGVAENVFKPASTERYGQLPPWALQGIFSGVPVITNL